MHGGLPIIGLSVLVYGTVGGLAILRGALLRRGTRSGGRSDGRCGGPAGARPGDGPEARGRAGACTAASP